MSSHFPIFVDVRTAPPLVIGDSDVLTPKIRLLLKVAPVVDVVSTSPSAASVLASSGHVHVLDAVTPHDDAAAIPARFQHMVKSSRSRMDLSVSQHKFGDS